jgi:outer membrane protein TolC
MNNVKLIDRINKQNIMPKQFFILLLTAIATRLPAQPVLDNYIRIGLDSNLALHQRNFDWQRAELDLRRARSLFYPQAGFSSQYTLANGGRTQAIPVGDLLNNVYSTLNQLTTSNKFPQVTNQSIQFLPNDFHDTKVEVSLPILNTDLLHNKEVSDATVSVRRAEYEVYRRDLVRSIRQAYYQFLQAGKAVDIYAAALVLVKENRRVSQKFVENHIATREIVLRSQAQVSQVESSLIGAENDRNNAAAFFNFLLNRSLDYPILTDSTLIGGSGPGNTQPPTNIYVPGDGPTSAPELIARREEFSRLKSYQRIMQSNLKWDRNYLVPRLNVFYDIGYQGYGIHLNSTQFYQLGGIQLNWTLFRANDNKYKIRQALIDIDAIDDQYRQLTQQLSLEQQTSLNNYRSALQALQALADETGSAREAYRLAERRFNEGQALQVELIDARTQMTSAELRYSLGRLAVLNRAADLERADASFEMHDPSRPKDIR